MNLIPWKNKSQVQPRRSEAPVPFESLRWEMDRVFDQFLRDPFGWSEDTGLFGAGPAAPALDVTETDGEVVVRAEVPGIEPDDLEITITGDVLTLCGEKREEEQSEREGWYQSERRFGSMRRAVQLPSYVDPDKVRAEHRNGVVTIHLEKRETARLKRIPIRSPRG